MFIQGQELESITFIDGTVIQSEQTEFGIFVGMVDGQMAKTPWASYQFNGKNIAVNLAQVELVVVK